MSPFLLRVACVLMKLERAIILLGFCCALWFLLVTIGNECFWEPERCDWEYIEHELREVR